MTAAPPPSPANTAPGLLRGAGDHPPSEPFLPLAWEGRASLELGQLLLSPVYYGQGVSRGDGAPVLLVPGFLSTDAPLSVLQGWLSWVGYRPYVSGLWLVAGSPIDLLAALLRRVAAVTTAAGQRVTLVGHSFGGVLSRAVAQLRPDLVRGVVTLGTPIGVDPRAVSQPLVSQLSTQLLRPVPSVAPVGLEAAWAVLRDLAAGPLPNGVAVTAVATRTDPVADWRTCLDPAPGTTAQVVSGSHAGLVWNTRVYQFLGQVLAQPTRTVGTALPA